MPDEPPDMTAARARARAADPGPDGGPGGATLETLTGAECRQLLAGHHVGRLGVMRGGYPLIVPVNYTLYGDDRVVVRTDPGTKLVAARSSRVSFEIDDIDEPGRSGWSVLVQGFAVEVTPDDPRYDEVSRVAVEPWAPGKKRQILLVTPLAVTGRRILRQGDPRPAPA